ncbi:hypothetical protein Tco_0186509 [Tanacetum coccineum]
MDVKTKLETTTKNTQALILHLEAKFDRLADKQSARHFGSLPSNTQPNPKGNLSKPYQLPQARNEHVNAIFTRSGKSYEPLVNPNDSQNPIKFDSDDEKQKQLNLGVGSERMIFHIDSAMNIHILMMIPVLALMSSTKS